MLPARGRSRLILARGEPVYGINTGFGRLASIRIEPADLATLQRNIVLSHAAGVGEPMPAPLVRLMLALKLASLGQGASGARLETVQFLAAMLSHDLLPVVPAQGSVGASGDLAPLAHMAAAMIGVGEIMHAGERKPAAAALAQAGMRPIVLGAKEGLALLNGTQFSTAYALAGLFEAETLLQAGLITGALSTDAARGSDAPFDPRIHALRGHRGQIDVARALRELIAGSAIRASHLTGDDRVQDPYCLRCQPQVMGAALDILRHAAATLQIEANGVSDNPLICGDPPEALSGGNFHGEPVAFAADIIALALCEIGAIAERRIAMLIDPALSRPAGVPDAKAGVEFRVHGAAGHRGRAGRREPPARDAGKRGFDSDLGQSGGSRVDVGACGAPAVADGGQCRSGDRHRTVGRGAGLRLPCAARIERDTRAGPGGGACGSAASGRGSRNGAGHRQGDCAGAFRPDRAGGTAGGSARHRIVIGGDMVQISNVRTVRAPRGTDITAKSWLTEAPLRMLMNNLDPEVAERPGELIVYGGIGRAARNWECYDRIVATLRRLEADQTLLVQSGKPVGVFRTHADAPRVLIANSNLVPHWATWEHFNELDRKGLMMFGQMTAGSWIYIGSQGIIQGTYETFVEIGRRHYGGSLAGRWILTAGLGGMGGAQPLAATMAGASLLAVECQASRIEMRLKTGYLDTQAATLDEALAVIERSCRERRPVSVGLLGNAADVLPDLLRRGVRPDVVTDQTSSHDPANGYLPKGWTVAEWERRREAAPNEVAAAARVSIAEHVRAMLAFHAMGVPTLDYGNNIRQVAKDEGVADAFAFPGFVPAYIRPLFCRGIGPFRWAALSGDPEDIYRTDAKVKELLPNQGHLHRWLDMARSRIRFQGLPARICWVGLGDRHRLGLAFNEMVARGELKAPIVIGRDHLDAGSVASPNRETEAMLDGSDAVSDWPMLNALLNCASGATWVSLHHGGGVGMGFSQHAGMVIVCDGTEAAARRIERVLWNDPASGVMRHADAGYDIALDCARENGLDLPGIVRTRSEYRHDRGRWVSLRSTHPLRCSMEMFRRPRA